MALVVNKPVKPDDFVLMQHTRDKLEAVLDGTVKFPGNGVCSLLLHGMHGTGKTTLAELFPGWLETCKQTNFLQANPPGTVIDSMLPNYTMLPCAQGQNGVTLINNIQTFTSLVSFNYSGLHYIILDEVDLLTPAASASLKAIMNRTEVVFILTSNHLNKVDLGVINRSVLLDMNQPPNEFWLQKVKQIFKDSNVTPPPDASLERIISASQGSARSILTDIEITHVKRSQNPTIMEHSNVLTKI